MFNSIGIPSILIFLPASCPILESMLIFEPFISNSFGIWPSILTFISEQTFYMYGRIDENCANGDTLIVVL
jgi:hypothetical protein